MLTPGLFFPNKVLGGSLPKESRALRRFACDNNFRSEELGLADAIDRVKVSQMLLDDDLLPGADLAQATINP